MARQPRSKTDPRQEIREARARAAIRGHAQAGQRYILEYLRQSGRLPAVKR